MTQQGPETTGADGGHLPVPDEIREAGRLAPDHWLGVMDPMWSGDGEPPAWVMVGRWRSGTAGEIEEWQDNPDYRPSPGALGWPAPQDEVDRAVQLAVTGYGPGEAVTEALVGREVAVLTGPGGGPLSATTPDGTPAVPLFTSPVFLHAVGRLGYELVGVQDLVPRVPEGHALYLNPSGPASMTLELDAVRTAVRAAVRDGVPPATPATPAVPVASVPSDDRAAGATTDAPGAETGTAGDSRRGQGTDA